MEEFKKGYLPISHGIHLSKDMCPKTQIEKDRMERIPYASAIGFIMYVMLSLCTRPNVSYALSIMSRYQSNPNEDHWKKIKNILKYFKKKLRIFFWSLEEMY
jgi:mevalonate pyrophosphate decarboxylase